MSRTQEFLNWIRSLPKAMGVATTDTAASLLPDLDQAYGEFVDYPENPAADKGRGRGPRDTYWVYTKRYDVEVRGERLHTLLESDHRRSVGEMKKILSNQRRRAPQLVEEVRSGAVRQFQGIYERLSPRQVRNSVLTLLIDQSGSTRGETAERTSVLCEAVVAACNHIGLPCEILGFTTTAWRGGRSRQKWIADGRPEKPGRLNDLLHIIYRSADDMDDAIPWSLQFLRWESILKENIDGEAVEWAAARLDARPEHRKRLIVVSDGAPVDDSTLVENEKLFLWNHLITVVEDIESRNEIALGGIGMAYNVSQVYDRNVEVHLEDDLLNRAIPFILEIVCDDA